MSLRRIMCVSCLLCCATVLRAQTTPQDPKQAKALFDKASSETDQVQQVSDWCKAAELDVKMKEYSDVCAAHRNALLASDRRALQSAQSAFVIGDFPSAIRFAKFVSSYDPALFNRAAELVKSAKADQQKRTTP